MKKKRMLIILVLGIAYAPFALADSIVGPVKSGDYDTGSVTCAFSKLDKVYSPDSKLANQPLNGSDQESTKAD